MDKKKIKHQYGVSRFTMLPRCLHDSSTDPLRLMTTELPITTVALRMLMMPPRFDTVLVQFKPVGLRYRHILPRMCTIQWLSFNSPGGGTLIFPSYVGLGPLSTVHPPPPPQKKKKKNIRNFKHPKKNLEY